MRRLVSIYIILTYTLWITSVWSFTKVNVEHNDIVLNNYKLMASPKITYKGPGRKVADRIKEQFSVSSDFEVRQVRKALKRYKRTEERRLIKKRRNIVSSERNADGAVKKSRSTLKDRSFKVVSKYTVKENEFTHFLRPLEKYTGKNPLGKATIKPVRMGIPLDTAASLYEGASPVVPTKSSPSQISTLEFIGSYIHTAILPSLALPEICLVGRSNVGKSSFINTMMTYMKTRKKSCDMAFVSKTPGYTKCINIFKAVDTKGRDVLSIADLPGYGFVKIKNRETVHAMNSALRAYLQRRNELKFIIFLIDGSLQPQSSDMEVHEMLKSMGIPFIIVCTKMDKVAQTQIPGQILLFRQVYKIESPLPIAYSKYGGADLGGIWGAIFDACRDKFDLANLSIADSYKSVKGADFEQYIKRQSMVSTKDLKELIYKNFELLPDSLKSANIDSMSKDELLDVLRVAAERSDFIRSKPIDLLEYKKKQTNR